MTTSWPARYRDAHGEVVTAVDNDGETLRITIDGVTFAGTDFDGLEARDREQGADVARFTFADGGLCACTLDVTVPVSVLTPAGARRATLEAKITFGAPRPLPRGGIDDAALQAALVVGDMRFECTRRAEWFEDALEELRHMLPTGWTLHTCFGCGLSDYSPGGHGFFGSLLCFRSNKVGYRTFTDKRELFQLIATDAQRVQETHLCPDFEPRLPSTGYRG